MGLFSFSLNFEASSNYLFEEKLGWHNFKLRTEVQWRLRINSSPFSSGFMLRLRSYSMLTQFCDPTKKCDKSDDVTGANFAGKLIGFETWIVLTREILNSTLKLFEDIKHISACIIDIGQQFEDSETWNTAFCFHLFSLTGCFFFYFDFKALGLIRAKMYYINTS